MSGGSEPELRYAAHIGAWFFRELSDTQRLSLLGAVGLPVKEIGPVHGLQKLGLKHALALKTLPAPPNPPNHPLPSAQQQDLALSHLRTALAVLSTYDPGTSDALAENFLSHSGVEARTHRAPPESEPPATYLASASPERYTPARSWDNESKSWVKPDSPRYRGFGPKEAPQPPAEHATPYGPAARRSIEDATDAHVQTEADALATLLSGPDRSCMVHVTVAFHDTEGTVRHAHGVAGRTTGATLRQFIIAARRQLEWLTDRLVAKRD